MSEQPIYNPNNIVRKEVVRDNVPVYNPNNIVKKEVVDARVFSKDANVQMPEFTSPKDLEIENAINFIDKQAVEYGRIAIDEDRKSVLRDVLKNPRATKEQKEKAILTVQGYDNDTHDVTNKFYMAKEANGVYVPTIIKKGTRPPKNAAINSFHGTQSDANDDAWYTDLSKSLVNGLTGAAGGLVDLAQTGTTLITGEESAMLNDMRNSVDFFKFKKDEDLNTPIYNAEGINNFADIFDKNRVDLSPKALWGTFNGLAESLSEFGFGTLVGGTALKGVKAGKYALQGVEKAAELGNAGQKASVFIGSAMSQMGDVMDSSAEAGLKGRDKAAYDLMTTSIIAGIDAVSGLEGKIMSDLFNRSKRQILQNAIKKVERNAAGEITEKGFKELAKQTSIQYGALAKNGIKEVVKDAVGEGTQEVAQSFAQKAAENVWDKMSSEDKAKFGTDALSAKSFGQYISDFSAGLFSGVPLAVSSNVLKGKNEEKSINIYNRVKEGSEAVNALKTDLSEALKGGDINQSEYEQAIFKIDSYDKYHQETKNVNLKPEDEKKAFELSFQIQGLKTEIPTNENEISKLEPIARAKVESKQKQVKELQSELNDIIRQGEIKGEPVVPKKEEERIQKEKEKEIKAEEALKKEETDANLQQKEPVKKTTAKSELESNEVEINVDGKFKKEPPLPKQPDLKDEVRTYDEIDNETFNNTKFPSRNKFKIIVDKLSKWQNKEMSGVIKKKSYRYYDKETKSWVPNSILEVELEDGKRIRFASSKYYNSKTEEGFRSHTRNERLLGNEEGIPVGLKLIDINNPKGLLVEGEYTPGKKVLKIYNKRTGQFLSWAKETHRGKSDAKKDDGNLVTTTEEGELIKTLEQQEYNEPISGNDEIAEIIKPKPRPTPTEKAAEATEKIVKESKEKVKQEKQKQNGKQESAVNGEKPVRGNNEETNDENESFQKESGKPSVYSQKVIDKLQKALPKVKIVFDANLKAAGKWSPSTNTITINPEYAGKDTAIHEAGHILIDAMGYENKIIQQAVKQLRGTDLYTETKQRYPKLNEEQLDKEVLAEAIGREGADIFDNVSERSKFKAYLDYIFDWLKQKLGIDKNIAKSLAKQIIGGVKTKDLKGTEKGTEQLQKEKKKNPVGVRALSFAQYAAEHGFSYEAETYKMDEAKVILQEATEEMELAKEDADNAMTDSEVEVAETVLAEKEAAYKEARKAYAIAGKRTFEYKQYKKDFNAIQEILKEKDLSKYSVEELQDLISRIHAFDNKAAKVVKEEAMLKLAFLVRKEIQAVHAKRDNYIESVADSKDITSLQKMLLHISHFTEHQPEMQKLSLEFGKAVMDKISDASTRKDIHEKLARKLITEENKRLGIVGAASNRFSSDSAKYFEWMDNGEGGLLTVDEAKAKGYSEARINYLKFTRETISDFKDDLTKDNYENVVMDAIKVDKGFMEAFKSEGLLEAFSYYLGGGGYNLGKVRIEHNGTIKSYTEIEKEILANTDKKSITSILSGLWELLKANVKARRQLKKGYNVDESVNPLEVRGEAEYSLNSKGQLVSKFDKPRSKDRGYSKDFYRAMNQFIDESAHTKHMSKIMPLVESVEYLNKKGYTEKGIMPKKNVAKWIEDWKALHIFKEPYVNDPVLDASIKFMRKLVASTTMWFNLPANMINVAVGNYNSWRQENGKILAKGNARLFGGKGDREVGGVVNKYALDIIKKYNIVNQDYDSQPTLRATNIFSKMATIGTQLGEYQIQGSLALGLMPDNVYNSFEYTKDKYGNDVLTVKEGVNEDDINKEILKVKNRVTDIQGKYPDEDRRNIMRGEIGKAVFQFKVWMPDWFRERFAPEYYNAFGERKEGTLSALYKDGFKKIKNDLKKGNFKELAKNKAFMSNVKGLTVIGALLALKYRDDDDENVRGKATLSDNLLGQILFLLDPEQDKYMVSNPVAALGKTKDFINAAEALITLDEKAWEKTKRVLPANKIEKIVDFSKKVVE